MSFRLKIISVASCLAFQPLVLTASNVNQGDQELSSSGVKHLIQKFNTQPLEDETQNSLKVEGIEEGKVTKTVAHFDELFGGSQDLDSSSQGELSLNELSAEKGEEILSSIPFHHESSIESLKEEKETVIFKKNQEKLLERVPFLKDKNFSDVFKKEILDHLKKEELSTRYLDFFGNWCRLFPREQDDHHAGVLKNRLNYASTLLLGLKSEEENFITDAVVPFSRQEAPALASELINFLGVLLRLTPGEDVILTNLFSPFYYLLNKQNSFDYLGLLGREIGSNTSLTHVTLDDISFYSYDALDAFWKEAFKNKNLKKISFINTRTHPDSFGSFDHFFERNVEDNTVIQKLWQNSPYAPKVKS